MANPKIETVAAGVVVESPEEKIARLEAALEQAQAKAMLSPQELAAEQGRARARGEMPIGANIRHKLEGRILTLVIDLGKTNGKTKSGDSWSVATSGGNVSFGDDGTRIGVNVFRSVQK